MTTINNKLKAKKSVMFSNAAANYNKVFVI